MPAWLAVALGIAAVISTVTLLLVILLGAVIFRTTVERWTATSEAQTKEIRILQLHVQDVESVLIQQGLAQRDDFAEWQKTETSTRPPARDKEK